MTIDLTGVIVAVIGGAFSIVGTVFLAWLQSHMKDQAAAATIGNAVKNSLGVIQQASTDAVGKWRPAVTIPGVPSNLAVGVQYVLDNATQELARFTDITPQKIAGKIEAQIGLASIATAASPAPSPLPLDPVPVPPKGPIS